MSVPSAVPGGPTAVSGGPAGRALRAAGNRPTSSVMGIRAADLGAILLGIMAGTALPFPWAPIGAALVVMVGLAVVRVVAHNC
jgi:hypothetical protein